MREHLSARQVIVYDLLGHGEAPLLREPVTLTDFVQQLHTALNAAGLAQCDLVGFSMGALVAQGFAAAYPGAIRRMILINPVFDRAAEERAAILQRVHEVRNGGYGASIDAALERWFTPAFASAHPEALGSVRLRLECNDVRSYAHAYSVFATADADVVDQTENIACPTLVVTGAEDLRSTPAMTNALAAAIPGGQSIIIDGARHMTPIEFPILLAGLVDLFCLQELA